MRPSVRCPCSGGIPIVRVALKLTCFQMLPAECSVRIHYKPVTASMQSFHLLSLSLRSVSTADVFRTNSSEIQPGVGTLLDLRRRRHEAYMLVRAAEAHRSAISAQSRSKAEPQAPRLCAI